MEIMEIINDSMQIKSSFNKATKLKNVNEKKSGDLKLQELEKRLNEAGESCLHIKSRLDYMKMLYETTGAPVIDNSLKLSSTKSTDSTCSEKRQFFCQSADEEENFHDVKSLEDIPKKADSDVYSIISEEKSLLSVNSFRVKSDEYFSASKQESHTHILTGREININMMQMLPQNDFNSKIYLNNQEFEASSEDSFNYPQDSEDSDQEEKISGEYHPPVPVAIKCIKKPEPNFKFNRGRPEYLRRAKLKKKSNSSRISNRLNLLAKPKYEIKKFDETARIKIKKRKTRLKKRKSKSIESRSRDIEDEKPKFEKENTLVISQDQSGNEVQDNLSQSSNIIPAVENVEIIERLNGNWSDVVEIYHNVQAKSISPSVVSSKQHFKLDIQQNIDYKDQNTQNNFQVEIDGRTSIRPEDFIRVDIQPHYNQNTLTRDQVFNHEECRSTQLHSWCCESFSVRSYQRPTKSSEAKKANRCFFTTRFDVRNIPFVVGTSITRSYNLGLNIQKVFGLMKNRHPETLNAIRPVLIRKVGETFSSTINTARSMHSDNCSGNEGSIITSKQNFCHELIGQTNNRVALKCNHYGDSIDTETVATHFTRSALLKQREEQLRESETFDSKCKRFTSNSGDVGKVLRRLQDQFEEMLEKYERLKDKIKKLNDVSAMHEVSELEAELNIKEEEIFAVAGLYKEVQTLKQQIKMMQQKKSLICITAGSTAKPEKNLLRRSRNSYVLPAFSHHQRPRTSCSIKPPTSSRLVGLLRYIQSVQQQLSTQIN